MSTKITVNGVTYDSLDALPPEARRMYEQALENMPEIGDRNRDGVPDILDLRNGPIQHRTVVRKKFIVNGQSYDDESAMPPDARGLRAGAAAARVGRSHH